MTLDSALKLSFCLLLVAYAPLTFLVDKYPAAVYPYWEVYTHIGVTLLPGLLLLARWVRLSAAYLLLVLVLLVVDTLWLMLFYNVPHCTEPWLFKGL